MRLMTEMNMSDLNDLLTGRCGDSSFSSSIAGGSRSGSMRRRTLNNNTNKKNLSFLEDRSMKAASDTEEPVWTYRRTPGK